MPFNVMFNTKQKKKIRECIEVKAYYMNGCKICVFLIFNEFFSYLFVFNSLYNWSFEEVLDWISSYFVLCFVAEVRNHKWYAFEIIIIIITIVASVSIETYAYVICRNGNKVPYQTNVSQHFQKH